MKRFAAIVGLVFAVAMPMARAQQSPDDQYIAIYSLIEQADTFQAVGQPRPALAAYTQALAQLQKIQKVFPDWDAKIVRFRLDYLTGKINGLAAQLPVTAQSAAPSAPAPTNAAASPTPPAANAVSAAPAADVEMQLDTLRTQVQSLQAGNDTLQAKLKEALSAQPATADAQVLAKAQAQVLSLTMENELMRASASIRATNSAAPGELLKVRQALAEANKKLAEQAAAATTNVVAPEELLKARQALADANKKLAEQTAAATTNVVAQVELLKAQQALADANNKLTEQAGRVDKLALENQTLQSEAGVNKLEKAALEDRLRRQQATATPAPAAPVPADTSDEVKTLRARLAVDEAQAVPYTPEELAMLQSPPPAQPPAAPVSQKKSTDELPGGSALLIAEAQTYFSAGNYDKAEADYLQILQSDPNNALVLANLAAIELQEQKFTEADTHITAALALTPDDAYTISTLGYLKFREQKYDEAFDALSRAAKLDPQNPQIQNYLGVTLSHKGLRAQAETALRRAIQLDPNYGAAHNNLAVIYLGETPPMPGLARWHYQKALELGQPHNADLEKTLADMGSPVNPQ